MLPEVSAFLDRLLEIQLEQNELAGRLAFAQAQRAIAMHNYFVHGSPGMGTAETDLNHVRGQFERNQERLRKLWAEVMAATAVPT